MLPAENINTDATIEEGQTFEVVEKAYHDTDEAAEFYFVLDGGSLFECNVLPGIAFEEIALPAVIELASEFFVVSDITVIWKEQSVPEYDSSLPGIHLFEGELIFPEHITPPGKVLVYYKLHVVEELPGEPETMEIGIVENSEVAVIKTLYA